MSIEIVAIGNEVLSGMCTNTNAAFIAKTFAEQGWKVSRHDVLGDDPKALKTELQEIFSRASLVVVTGGLGPTGDDVTREALVELFNAPLCFNAEIAADLKRRFGSLPIGLENQATIPEGAMPLLNPVGTAPGLLFVKEEKTLIALPGVPREMMAILQESVVPYLKRLMPSKICTQVFHVALSFESDVDPFLRELAQEFPDVRMGIYPDLGNLHISLTAENNGKIEPVARRFCDAFSERLFSSSSGSIAESLHALCTQRKKMLALAESCTGGAMSRLITALPGASEYFLGSLVVYSNSLKEKVLGVSKDTLAAHGAVSRETVEEMLKGLFTVTSADYGIAVTGIAGPTGGSPEKPIGTIWAAMGERGSPPEIFCLQVRGNRDMIIQGTAQRLLTALWRWLQKPNLDPNPRF